MTEQSKQGAGVGWGSVAVAGAAVLGGLALFNRQRARRNLRMHPALGRFLDVEGVTLHVVERGRGPELVLIHGNGVSIEDWTASGMLDRLATTYRVIAIDRPGYGHSDRPRSTVWTPAAQAALIVKAFEMLHVTRPVVVGHSWGSMVAVAMALDKGADLAGLVLLSGYYYPTARIDTVMAAPSAIPLVGDILRHTVSPIVGAATYRGLAKALFAPAAFDERFMTANRDLALRPSQIQAEAADGALMVPAAKTMSKRYGEIIVPVAIAGGSGDLLVDTEKESERLHQAIPGSTFRRIEGAGHLVHYSHQDEVVSLIDDLNSAKNDQARQSP